MMQSFIRWPRSPVYILILAILLILIPDRWEGPVLFQIDSEHNLSLIDLVAMAPLLASVTWIQRGVWKRRIYLFNKVTIYPGAAVLIVFFMGIGLGMLLVSGFSAFRYWWAIGGILVLATLIDVVLVSGRSRD
ncbi:MAG TPA: hypothetical protein VI583_04460 [Cyclobacteriaceae bacterium]|nr:hypothetical protein [Cyclobacteriaceae bacterium]